MNVLLPYVASLLTASLGLPQASLLHGPWMPERGAQELLAKGKVKQSKGGGGHHGGRGSGGRTGFQHASPSFDRGDLKPIGGWRNGHVGSSDVSRDSRSRLGHHRDGHGSSGALQGDWQRAGDRWDQRRDRAVRQFDKDWQRAGDRWDRRLDRAGDHLDHRLDRLDHRLDRWDDWGDRWPGWARRGWGLARPWNYGWYSNGINSSTWGWWGARAAAWGIGTLATASVINNAVDEAIDAQRATIVVPDSSYRLLYGSVAPRNEQSLSFSAVTGDRDVSFTADCRAGDLNGQPPATVAEAQLLNAACQVAFGN